MQRWIHFVLVIGLAASLSGAGGLVSTDDCSIDCATESQNECGEEGVPVARGLWRSLWRWLSCRRPPTLEWAATGTAVRVVHPSRCPDIGPICDVRDEPPQQHDQLFYVSEPPPVLEPVQFGTGTFNPLLGLDVARALGPVAVRGYSQAQLSLYENRHGYRAGTRILGGAELSGRVWRDLQISGDVDVFNEAPERWDGLIQQDGNLGRTDVLLGASLAYPVGGFNLNVGVKVPVYQHVIRSADHEGGSCATRLSSTSRCSGPSTSNDVAADGRRGVLANRRGRVDGAHPKRADGRASS